MKHIGSHRLDAIQTPTNTYHNTRQVSTDPCRLLSIDPLRFPRVLSIDPLRFPRVLSIDPLRFPRVLSIDPLRFLRPLSIDPLRPFCTEPLLPISIEPLRPCRKRYKEMCGFKFLKKNVSSLPPALVPWVWVLTEAPIHWLPMYPQMCLHMSWPKSNYLRLQVPFGYWEAILRWNLHLVCASRPHIVMTREAVYCLWARRFLTACECYDHTSLSPTCSAIFW